MKILLLVFLTVSCWLVPIRGFSSIIPPTVPQSTADTETITLDNDNHAPKQKQQKQHDYQDQDRLPGIPAPLCKLKRTVYLNGSLHHVAELMYNQPKNQMKIVTTVLGKEMILSWFRDGVGVLGCAHVLRGIGMYSIYLYFIYSSTLLYEIVLLLFLILRVGLCILCDTPSHSA